MHPGKKRKKASPEESDPRAFTAPVRMRHEAPPYIVETGENDILLGRGKPIINYIGNRRFRELVRTRKEEYANSPRSHTKEVIAREILEVIRQRGGSFLQRVTSEMRDQDQSIPDDPEVWKVVDLNAALSKIKQTLRDREYVRSSERQREAVAYIEEQHRLALSNQSSAPYSSLSVPTVPRSTLLGSPLSPPLHLPVSVNFPDMQLLQHVRRLDQWRRESDFRMEQLQHMIAAQQMSDIRNNMVQQPILPSLLSNFPRSGDVPFFGPVSDASRLRQSMVMQSLGRPSPRGPTSRSDVAIMVPPSLAEPTETLDVVNTATAPCPRSDTSSDEDSLT